VDAWVKTGILARVNHYGGRRQVQGLKVRGKALKPIILGQSSRGPGEVTLRWKTRVVFLPRSKRNQENIALKN